MKYVALVDGKEHHIQFEGSGEVTLDAAQFAVLLESIDHDALFTLLVGTTPYEVAIEPGRDRYAVTVDGHRFVVQVGDEQVWQLEEGPDEPARADETTLIKSPMPGVVVEVLVQEGQTVHRGDGIAILEAMKMENEIRAPRDGTVTQVFVTAGQTLNVGDQIACVGSLAETCESEEG